MDISFCSYNCCSLRKNIDIVRQLTEKKYDFIFLQETFVTEDKLGQLDYIDENYESAGLSAVYSEQSLVSMSGRPRGGMACLWRTDSMLLINKVILEDNICILCVSFNNFKMILVNVYIKSDIWEVATQAEYLNMLNKLEMIMSDYQYDYVYYLGDFNADPLSGRAWGNLNEFMLRNELVCLDYQHLPSDTFTFTSYGNSHCKWLDHVLGKPNDSVSTTNFKVHYELIGSDHLPISFSLHLDNENIGPLGNLSCNTSYESDKYIDWEALKPEDIQTIETIAIEHLKNVLDLDANHCRHVGCRDKGHWSEIVSTYNNIVKAISLGCQSFKKSRKKKNKFKIIPGWNRRVKDLHRSARFYYLEWISHGKRRDTMEHINMKNSRSAFKQALNLCKSNEFHEVCYSIEEKYKDKNMSKFWNEVKQRKYIHKKSNIIDGTKDPQKILNIFTENFLPNTLNFNNDRMERSLISNLKDRWRTCRKFNIIISSETIRKLLKKLNKGVGHDGIHTIFLNQVSNKFLDFLSIFINSCFNHCFFPSDILKGDLNPTIKDLKGNVTVSSNYRPVMQSSILLKLIELHILSYLEEKISFNFRQFGFREGCSTTDASLILKETVFRYIQKKGKSFAAFIDLSKAFDKVNHFILGQQLLERNIQPDVVLLILCYLRNQSGRVCWNQYKGEYVFLDMGVRQGGILSPFLFKLYIDNLLNNISEENIGCTYGIVRMNILGYADDIVLLADTRENLSFLYTLLVDGIKSLELTMNSTKSKCMIFTRSRNICETEIRLGEDVLEVVETYRYLGHIIERQLLDIDDIKHQLNGFYAKFNSIFRNFKDVSIETFLFLFNSYCLPEYGLPLWNVSYILNKHIFKTFETAFSNSLKKILGAPTYASSHMSAEACNVLLFNHHLSLVQVRYVKRIFRVNNTIIKLSFPYLKSGYLCSAIDEYFNEKYNLDIWLNDLDAIRSRIMWVQKHEERRRECPFFENVLANFT